MTSIADHRETALLEAKGRIGSSFTTRLYHSIFEHHGMGEVNAALNAALRRFDTKAMVQAIADALLDELATACTPDEARDPLAQWDALTSEPLLYAPSVDVAPGVKLDSALFGTT